MMENKSVNIFYCELNLLSQDNTSGSKELLTKLNKLIIDNINYIDFNKSFFKNLLNTFQSFEAIHKYLIDLECKAASGKKTEIYSFIKSYGNLRDEVYKQIYSNLKQKINEDVAVITISNSETIFEVLKQLKEDSLLKKVIVSESRPQNEGRILARKLLENNIEVELIVEAQIPDFTENIDVGLIGSDKILGHGNVVNKIGSGLLALSCKHYRKPVYVLSDSTKFSSELNFSQINHPRKEIWQNAPEDISILNYYFEEINKDLITEIITEK